MLKNTGITIALAMLSMVGALGIDAYLPSLQAIGQSLQADPATVQQTLSIYIAMMAFTTLFAGKQQQITISGSTALSDEEVDRMVKDAESHAEEDKKHKDEIEVRNQTDSLCYSTEQTLKDLGDKAPAGVRSEVEAAVAEAKKALDGTDAEAIKAAGQKLQDAGHKLAEIVYSDTDEQASGAGAEQAATPNSSDDVVDADYEVVDDDKGSK